LWQQGGEGEMGVDPKESKKKKEKKKEHKKRKKVCWRGRDENMTDRERH